MSSALFSPITLRSLKLENRIVVSPMCQYNAVHGSANDWHLMHLGQYAMGAAGLVMTESTHVSAIGRISHKCLGLYSDENEVALRRIVDFCRNFGVSALGIQIGHSGRKGSVNPPLSGGMPLKSSEQSWETLAPSSIPYRNDWHIPRELTISELSDLKSQFVMAVERAARIGFDLAELHAGHGYLLHQFLSPLSNRRDDEYGGTLNNRMRFPLDVFEAVRQVWPDNKPLGIRVSATDWVDGGLIVDDIVQFCRELKLRGCDFVDVTSGGLHPDQKIKLGPGYQVPLATRVRSETGMPVMAVGMITDPHQAEDIVSSEQADMIAIARGMMWDPRWAWHAAEALGVDTAYSEMYQRCHPSRWSPTFAEVKQ